jgi:hypothetical protein
MNANKSTFRWSVGLASLFTAVAFGQAPVTLTVDTRAAGPPIPSDFLGISFEASNLLPEKNGEHIFSAENRALIDWFRVMGIGSLRIGGSTADMPNYAVPGEKDIDNLFAFAAAADVKVLYTLRLPRADVANDAAVARYIMQHYSSQLTCFEIGNEPDFYRRVYREIPDYATYRAAWEKIATAVRKAAPAAKFCGTAAGGTTAWARSFAADFAQSGWIAAVVMHEYPGGDGGLISGAPARDAMLSRGWMELYDRLYTSFGAAAQSHRLPYRLEETNNFTGGAKDATDTFTASLWALDYLHWWAAHGAGGLNFHNHRWILNTTLYPVKKEDDGLKSGYQLHPIAYGIKAYDVGGHGRVLPVAITSNPEAVNVTAYAVRADNEVYVTVINKKDPGVAAQDVEVTIAGVSGAASVMLLESANHDVAAKEGITLGGAELLDGKWDGKWTPAGGKIRIAGGSAGVVRIGLKEKE